MTVTEDFLTRLNIQNIHDVVPVRGGDINEAYSLYSGTQHYFLKVQKQHPASFFDVEIAGLTALSQVVRTPKVIANGEIRGDAYLILEWIDRGKSDQGALGRTVANLHQKKSDNGLFGFDVDNLNDTVPKHNDWQKSWAEFFVTQRLDPLMAQAKKQNSWLTQRGNHYEQLRETILQDDHAQTVQPSLLHGDLWSGNFMFDRLGTPILIDPNSFYGDREYDIAISQVFSGFKPAFYESYEAAYPLDSGFQTRANWYKFYYILMHFVRFGDIYAPRVDRLLATF
ncbi:fructosamine kinase family protein [Leuconostoc fallax]|uniref:Aminoglycoside phosphotransferase domain-containing protein n=1 Tax=Leuconostoc fallax TaxID=1251 RepID=A0A4R5N7E5_9LACO|nr:fructosamine kinase family protein [Leuconostoc fallax]MBU7455142.1 fructosamine kinase family protein [Leuconostoc fallax]TDG67755.1 hypothetical protein C5L23_001554 [Leuconostoc fallax]